MRDHRRLRVFEMAHELVLEIYRITATFPAAERYGLVAQLRRSAVSVSANIVEGSARAGEREFDHFLQIAFASSRESGYYLRLAKDLDYIDAPLATRLEELHGRMTAALASLIQKRRKARRGPR